jgi:hypothetical protein
MKGQDATTEATSGNVVSVRGSVVEVRFAGPLLSIYSVPRDGRFNIYRGDQTL